MSSLLQYNQLKRPRHVVKCITALVGHDTKVGLRPHVQCFHCYRYKAPQQRKTALLVHAPSSHWKYSSQRPMSSWGGMGWARLGLALSTHCLQLIPMSCRGAWTRVMTHLDLQPLYRVHKGTVQAYAWHCNAMHSIAVLHGTWLND